MPKDYLNFVSV